MIETGIELAEAAKKIATNYKTLYIWGCFGDPMTKDRKQYHLNNYEYNKQPTRRAMINAASEDTFGFDCVCLIKGLLWGWNGNRSHSHGGAIYGSNDVPDIDANQMLDECSGISTDFSKIEVGEAVGMQGHIGIYIGDGLAVECTPQWKNGVQITAVQNIAPKIGYDSRRWTRHGKLPYVRYSETSSTTTIPSAAIDVDSTYSKVSSIYLSAGVAAIRNEPNLSKPAVSKRCIKGKYYLADRLYLPDGNGQKWFKHAAGMQFSALTDVDGKNLFEFVGTYTKMTVKAPVNVRDTPSLSGKKAAKLLPKTEVYCTSNTTSANGITWIQIIHDGYLRWCDKQWLG